MKNFLKFWLDTIEKQNIRNLSSSSSENYTSEVLSDSEVAFLQKVVNTAFRPFPNCVLVLHRDA